MNKNYIYKRRLLKLADFLETLPPARFNYRSWVGHDWRGKQGLSCGTTACALGWSTTIPSFRKLGLRLFKTYSGISGGTVALKEDEHNLCLGYEVVKKATLQIFGLDADETNYLFIPSSQREFRHNEGPGPFASAKEVATHIKNFVAEKYT